MITKITDKETENMWVMTSFGILMPSIRPPHTVPEGDNRTIQVRTRREQDLDILRDEYMGDELGPTIATPTFDYNFRAYCTPEAWGRALFDMALEIDYEKFKPTTDRYDDHELHGVYNSIWGTVCRLNAPWGGKGWSNEPITTHTEPLGTSGYTVVAGPPKKTEPKGYVWDVKPKGEKPEAIAEVEFSDGEQSEEATVLTQEDDELVVEILRMSEEDWDYLLTDERGLGDVLVSSPDVTLCPHCEDFDAQWEKEQELGFSPGATYWENWQTFYVCTNCGHAEDHLWEGDGTP